MVRTTAWVEPLAVPVGSTVIEKEAMSSVNVSVCATVTVAAVDEEPKVTDCEAAESIVAGTLVWVVTIEV